MINNIKTIALYLPQFHQVPENDKWWGKGFTDWAAVKKAKSLFKGHIQPKIPLNNNYYDLMDKHTMQWQANLAKKYSIDGFCFYHYYFKDGKKILEKPAENLLKWKDMDMSFCFSWANETWARSWSNISSANIWADTFEDKISLQDNGILLEQKYGLKEDWKDHFKYLLPFFLDSRYIKINNKPVFLIYRPELIPCISNMIIYWRKLALQYGLSGLYIVGTDDYSNNENLDAVMCTMSSARQINAKKLNNSTIKGADYESTWKCFLEEPVISKKNFWCGMVDYDDTPRHGCKGTLYLNTSVDKFEKYFKELVIKSVLARNELVFLNAWNEWGEGMHLEPDTVNKYAYLEAVHKVMIECRDINVKERPYEKYLDNNNLENVALKKQLYKTRQNYNLLRNWLLLKENNKSLKDFFVKNNFASIAIYGFGVHGKFLFNELYGKIDIRYIVDQKVQYVPYNLPIYNLSNDLPNCDVIIITVINEFSSIEKTLRDKKVTCPIISLSEIIFECN